MRYFGGKNAVYQKLINLIPPHAVYIEPFLGSGAMLRNKRPARCSIGIDKDAAILEQVAAITGYPIVTFAGDDVVIAKAGDDAGAGLLVHMDGLLYLAHYHFTGNEFVYCDPPYLMATRRSATKRYRFEFDEQDHRDLLAILVKLPCPVMLSGYDSPLYRDRLVRDHGWRAYSFQSQTHNGMATETVWMNYPIPSALHDYRYLGDTFRERERIKRKKDRWVNRLANMGTYERQAILWAISEWADMESGLTPAPFPADSVTKIAGN
jgi:hypothetical protein